MNGSPDRIGRRDFSRVVGAGLVGLAAPGLLPAQVRAFDPAGSKSKAVTLHAAAEEIRQGRLSPVELLDTCLARIARHEPNIRAWVLVDRTGARADAERLTQELKRGLRRGPLHGIPIGIKDIFDVFDWPTAAGSKLWARSIARRDATVVWRLRRAGAVLLGKTVTTAYASFDPPPTRNPWDLKRTPGGSSSGSAAAVACGMCLGAIGSQTGGSITRPASYCGVAGCKPTYGRVSMDGVVPLAPSMDHAGPMARSVRDLAILLQAIAGPDGRDPNCSTRSVPDFPHLLEQEPKPPRLGRLHGLFDDGAAPAVKHMMTQVEKSLRSGGATLTDLGLPASFAEALPRGRTIVAVEAAAYHGDRLRRHPDDYPPRIRELIEKGLACPATEYHQCRMLQRQLCEEMKACIREIDALLCPATPAPAPDASTTGDPAFNYPWSFTGLPTVSIPAGKSPEGLPLAIQLVGPAWGEAELLRTAAWCERALNIGLGEPAAAGG